MPAHVYHNALPGYDPRQIWYDGCPECESRAANLPMSINMLDTNNLRIAIERTKDWMYDQWDIIGDLSQAEIPLLRMLEAFLSIQNRLGIALAL